MTTHPVKRLRRAAQRQIGALEKEVGFDIKVVKGSVRRAGIRPEQNAETLHAQLLALRRVSEHLVVVFDEFQRLRSCPGGPLAIIRSALMSSGANHVSLLLTGSIRNALQMMLEDSEQPLFGEAAHLQLPQIGRADFLEYLDYQFEATGKPADGGRARLPAERDPLAPAQHAAARLGVLDGHARPASGSRSRRCYGRTTGWCRPSSAPSSVGSTSWPTATRARSTSCGRCSSWPTAAATR